MPFWRWLYDHTTPKVTLRSWVVSVPPGDPQLQSGTRYYPETDSFVMPPQEVGDRLEEISAREFLELHPGTSVAKLRRHRLNELRTTGKIEGRETDRYGKPWPADRRRPVQQANDDRRRHAERYGNLRPMDMRGSSGRRQNNHGRRSPGYAADNPEYYGSYETRHRRSERSASRHESQGTRRRGAAYSVELADVPEESVAPRMPLLLTQYPHVPSRHSESGSRHGSCAPSRHSSHAPSSRASSSHASSSRAPSARSSRR